MIGTIATVKCLTVCTYGVIYGLHFVVKGSGEGMGTATVKVVGLGKHKQLVVHHFFTFH